MAAPHPENSDLMDFAARTLSEARHSQVGAHLESCNRCRKMLESFAETTSPSGGAMLGDDRLAPTDMGDALIGQTLDGYRVIERLGQGGMGVLYRGEQPVIGKTVAIKVLLPEIASDATLVQRMIAEARAVNAVKHPNIVDIFAFGQLPDHRPYLVMELLSGESLAETLKASGRLTVQQVLVVLSQSMAALEAAHAVGVVHRDLKPDNIFVDRRPEGWKVTLLDFGLATREGSKEARLTSPGIAVGTPGFMAPEQVRGQGDITAKADIYAMGVVAWTLLAGREPFAGGSIVEIMHRHLTMPAPPLSAEVPDLPPALEALVMQMLEKDPAQRPISTEVRRAANRLLNKPLTEVEGVPRQTLSKVPALDAGPKRVGRTAALGAGVLVATTLTALWFGRASMNTESSPRPPDPQPIARPLVPVVPVAAVDAGPSVVAEVPTPPIEREVSLERRWPCKRVSDITPVFKVMNAAWYFFALSIDDEPRALVTAPAEAKPVRDLRRVREAINGCRFSDKVIVAKRINDQRTTLFTVKAGMQTGIEIKGTDISVDAKKR